MYRKNDRLIALALREAKPALSDHLAMGQWEITVLQFAHSLSTNYPRFSTTKFYLDCGYVPRPSRPIDLDQVLHTCRLSEEQHPLHPYDLPNCDEGV